MSFDVANQLSFTLLDYNSLGAERVNALLWADTPSCSDYRVLFTAFVVTVVSANADADDDGCSGGTGPCNACESYTRDGV